MQETRNAGLISSLGRPPGGGHEKPLKYLCLENPTSRGAWQTTLHGVTKSWTQPPQLSTLDPI